MSHALGLEVPSGQIDDRGIINIRVSKLMLRLVPPLGNLLLLGHVCLAYVVTVGIKISKNISLTNKRALNTVLLRKF